MQSRVYITQKEKPCEGAKLKRAACCSLVAGHLAMLNPEAAACQDFTELPRVSWLEPLQTEDKTLFPAEWYNRSYFNPVF